MPERRSDRQFQSLGPLYPGDAYVDWTCLDGYNWGSGGSAATSPTGWMTFDQLYGSTYRQIADTIAPSKPMVIGEIGSSERGGSKAEWLQDALARAPSYPKIRGLRLLREATTTAWTGRSRPPRRRRRRSPAASEAPTYTANDFANLATSPIPPPS